MSYLVSEKELIDGCKSYNRTAQRLLYTQYSPKMYAVCVRYLKDKEKAKDLLQDGFIKVFANIHKYSAKGSLEGWIRRLFVNIILNHLTKEKKYKWENLDTNEVSISQQDLSHESNFEAEENEFTKKELDDALDRVPELYKIVFNLYHIDEFSHTEIAQLLSIDEGTSRTRLYRAKKILKEYLINIRSTKNSMKKTVFDGK